MFLLCIALLTPAPLFAVEPSSAAKKSVDRADSTTRSSTKKTSTPRKPAKKTAAQIKQEAARAKWLDGLKEREVDPWPENETDDEHAEALKKSREMALEVVSLFSGSQLHETQHFLFVSNIPPPQIAPYVASLDRMYDLMCQLYGVPARTKSGSAARRQSSRSWNEKNLTLSKNATFPNARETLRARSATSTASAT